MAVRIGINGFGRIGRMVFRAIAQDFSSDFEVVGINDLLDADYLAYMLKYDSVHGRFGGDVAVDGSNFVIDGKKVRLTAERDPADLRSRPRKVGNMEHAQGRAAGPLTRTPKDCSRITPAAVNQPRKRLHTKCGRLPG